MRSGDCFCKSHSVSVMRTPNASAWLSSVAADADGEFLSCVSQDDEDIYAISCGEETVGLALAAIGTPSFLYVYIFLPFRGRGFGTAAICRLEEMLGKAIQTCCRFDDAPALRFLARMGYTQDFTSSYMVYSGLNYTLADVPIRPYTAADFEAAHRLTAEAFHKCAWHPASFPIPKSKNRMRKLKPIGMKPPTAVSCMSAVEMLPAYWNWAVALSKLWLLPPRCKSGGSVRT